MRKGWGGDLTFIQIVHLSLQILKNNNNKKVERYASYIYLIQLGPVNCRKGKLSNVNLMLDRKKF